MNNITLRLIAQGKEPQELVMQEHKLEASIIDAAKESVNFVFCDFEYTGKIVSPDNISISDLQVYVNGNHVNATFSPETGDLLFNDYSFGARIFTECYGFVQISIVFDTKQGQQMLETEYIQVMVRRGKQNDSVRRMVEFISNNNSSLLYGNRILPKDAVGFKESTQQTLESKLLLLKQISLVFEKNYKYFKTNSRYTTIPRENIDNFEKLQFVSGKTIQHITQHPEELFSVGGNPGIKIGTRNYHPIKTLITNNVPSFDIYENEYIVGFLYSIIGKIKIIEKEIGDVISSVPKAPKESDNYITSSYFLYVSTAESLKIALQDIIQMKKKYEKLYAAYNQILPIKKLAVNGPPKPTAIFMAVPQYRHIYDCMVSWFKMGAFSIAEHRYLLSFLRVSALYEVYILSKLICHFLGADYHLEAAEKKIYTFSGKTLYENTTCNNYFVFTKGESRITIYYQPVVYSTDKSYISGIGLYRNTSIPFPKNLDDDIIKGKYYTPDFIIKYESSTSPAAKYLIADAKFSTLTNVIKRQVAALAYKYLFSISVTNSKDSIVSLCIVNGQSDIDTDAVKNIRDYTPAGGSVSPVAEILTLTENSESNKEEHFQLLKQVFCRFI